MGAPAAVTPGTRERAEQLVAALSPRQLAGQLVMLGFDGEELPGWVGDRIGDAACAGLILFRRNLPNLGAAARIAAAAHARAAGALPVFVSVDEEGGRVRRLPPPFPGLPSARRLGASCGPARVRDAGHLVGEALAHLGINLNFAPVLDVDTNPANPVIGDRAFSSEPEVVGKLAVAFEAGLRAAGVLGCGKHFPGHGDTDLDSHLALPVVRHDLVRMDGIELAPFRAAVAAGFGAIMTAHVVFPALDAVRPATLSAAVVGGLLRGDLGFQGLVISDDLDMKAVAGRAPPGDLAVAAVAAGVDVVLACRDRATVEGALDGLAGALDDPSFADRARTSATRSVAARLAHPARAPDVGAVEGLARSPLARDLAVNPTT